MVEKNKTSFLQKIFSITKAEPLSPTKTVTIFGMKFSIKNKNKAIFERLELLESAQAENDAFIFDFFQNLQCEKLLNNPLNIEEELKKIKEIPTYLPVDSRHNFLNILLNLDEYKYTNEFDHIPDIYFCWEIRPNVQHTNIIKNALRQEKNVVFVGDSFLRSINTFAEKGARPKYQKGISFTLDDLTAYFDATRPSRLENMLNDKSFVLTDEQKQRARRCIDKIVETHLTKYNHQPIFEPKIGRKGAKKVLVVDQTYGDMSILKGLGSEKVFEDMLEAAIKENPDADIIVKTHPDVIAGKKGGYYADLIERGNIYKMTDPINPISLIKYADKVYVCSTQLGFEALMCGKETHVFGMPFYAGWGLSNDRQKCLRRDNTRTLEEVFYLAYISYSYYVNPKTKKRCEIEEAIDYLLELRDEYFFNNK